MDLDIPSPESLLEDNITKFFHFSAVDYGYDGSIKALVFNWLHHLMLSVKTANTNGENTTWIQAINGPFDGENLEAAGTDIETLERIKAW